MVSLTGNPLDVVTSVQAYLKNTNPKIANHVASADWLGFLDALGWMENGGSYAEQKDKNGNPLNPYFFGKTKGTGVDFFPVNRGNDRFREQVEAALGRRVGLRPRGRREAEPSSKVLPGQMGLDL